MSSPKQLQRRHFGKEDVEVVQMQFTYGDAVVLKSLPLRGVPILTSAATNSKDGDVRFFEPIGGSSEPFVVCKRHFGHESYHAEVTALNTMSQLIGPRCCHLPTLFPDHKFLGGETWAGSPEALWMPFGGFDVASTSKEVPITKFDVGSLYLQLIWTIMTVGDIANIGNSDLHGKNILVHPAPYGGHFIFRFKLVYNDTDYHELILRTRIKLAIIDWVRYQRADVGSSAPDTLLSVVGQPRPSSSSSSGKTKATNPFLVTGTSSNLAEKAWASICSKLPSEVKSYSVSLDGRPTLVTKLTGGSKPTYGVQMWLDAAEAFQDSSCRHEFVHLSHSFSNFVRDYCRDYRISLKNFTQTEEMCWTARNDPIVFDQLLSQPLETTDEKSNKKKRGRPTLFAEPMSNAQKLKRSRVLRKLKELEATDWIVDYLSGNGDVSTPLDSSLVCVKPSSLHARSLGVFATTFIAKGRAITAVSSCKFPEAGKGVGQLVLRGDEKNANVTLSTDTTDDCMVIYASRDIEKDSELILPPAES